MPIEGLLESGRRWGDLHIWLWESKGAAGCGGVRNGGEPLYERFAGRRSTKMAAGDANGTVPGCGGGELP
jgi:hypothetical protein